MRTARDTSVRTAWVTCPRFQKQSFSLVHKESLGGLGAFSIWLCINPLPQAGKALVCEGEGTDSASQEQLRTAGITVSAQPVEFNTAKALEGPSPSLCAYI